MSTLRHVLRTQLAMLDDKHLYFLTTNERELKNRRMEFFSLRGSDNYVVQGRSLLSKFRLRCYVQDGLLWQRHLNKSSSGFLGAKRGRIGQRLIKPIESLHLAESLLPARSELVSPKKFRKG